MEDSPSLSFSSARQLVKGIQFRGDAVNLQLLRSSNYAKFQQLKEQNYEITNLKKSLVDARRILYNSLSSSSFESTSTTSSCSTSSSYASLSKSSMSPTTTTTPSSSLSSSPSSSPSRPCHRRRPSLTKILALSQLHQQQSDHSGLLECSRTKGEQRITIMDIFITAIATVQKHYRRVLVAKLRDELIRASTLPSVTMSNNPASTGCGLVSYPDRLLHAANLEDNIDRCLEKQDCIIREAHTKLPSAIHAPHHHHHSPNSKNSK